jgi:lysophospholipase L1-like esterase
MPRLLNAVVSLAAITLVGCAGGAGPVRGSQGEPAVHGPITSVAPYQAGKGVVVPQTARGAIPVPLAPAAAHPAAPPPPPVQQLAQQPAAVAAGPIVALGDSITFGYGTGAGTSPSGPPPAHSYPWYLARELRLPVVNAGVSGTTAYGLLDPTWAADSSRPAHLRLPALLGMHPRLVIVGFGSNEAIRGWPMRQTVHDLDRLLDTIAAARVPVVLMGTHVDCFVMPCRTAAGYSRQRYTDAWDAALGWLAAKHGAHVVYDVEGGFTPDDFTDWIHPSSQGYALIAQRVAPAVIRALGGERATGAAASTTSTTTAAHAPTSPPTADQDRAPEAEQTRRDPPPPQSIWDGQWGGRSYMRLPLLEILLGRGIGEVAQAASDALMTPD